MSGQRRLTLLASTILSSQSRATQALPSISERALPAAGQLLPAQGSPASVQEPICSAWSGHSGLRPFSTGSASVHAAAAGTPAGAARPAGSSSTPSGAAAPPAQQEEQKPSVLYVEQPSTSLTAEHVGNYYALQQQLLPEAFPALHQAFYTQRASGEERAGGCIGLQQEMQAVGGRYSQPVVMYREAVHALASGLLGSAQALQSAPAGSTAAAFNAGSSAAAAGAPAAAPGGPQGQGQEASTSGRAAGPMRLLLHGPRGSGKSVGLAAVVEQLRASGWLVMYIPSARALLRGGYYEPRSSRANSGNSSSSGGNSQGAAVAAAAAGTTTYDTLISAQHILLGMQQAHGTQLAGLQASQPASLALLASSSSARGGKQGGSLADLVLAGLATDSNAALAVDAVLALLAEMKALPAQSTPTLVAIDDYNALYGPTEYGRPVALASDESDSAEPEQAGLGAAVEQEELGGDEEGRLSPAALAVVAGRRQRGGKPRKMLKVQELTLARAMRLLAEGPADSGNLHVVGALSMSLPNASQRVPTHPAGGVQHFFMPRLSMIELVHQWYHYWESGYAPEAPTKLQAARLLALTNGNAKEVRLLAGRTSMLAVPNKKGILAAA